MEASPAVNDITDDELEEDLDQIFGSGRADLSTDLITVAEAARLRGMTKSAIEKWVQRKRLTSYKIGGITLLVRNDVLQYKPYGRSKSVRTTTHRDIFDQTDKNVLLINRENVGLTSDTNPSKNGHHTKSVRTTEHRDNSVSKTAKTDCNSLKTKNVEGTNSDITNNQNLSRKKPLNSPNTPLNAFKAISKENSPYLTKFELNYFNPAQVAEELDCSERFVRKLIYKGRLKAEKIGKRWLITKTNLAAFKYAQDQERLNEQKARELYEVGRAKAEKERVEINYRFHTNLLLEALFSPHASPEDRDLAKKHFRAFLLGYITKYRIDVLAEVMKDCDVFEFLSADTDLTKFAPLLQERIEALRQGKYIYYEDFPRPSAEIMQTAIDNVEYYHQLLNKIQDKIREQEFDDFLNN